MTAASLDTDARTRENGYVLTDVCELGQVGQALHFASEPAKLGQRAAFYAEIYKEKAVDPTTGVTCYYFDPFFVMPCTEELAMKGRDADDPELLVVCVEENGKHYAALKEETDEVV